MTKYNADGKSFADSAREILESLLKGTELEYTGIQFTEVDGQMVFTIETTDPGRIIGRTSQTLDALQFLVNRLQSNRFENAPYCLIDTGGYRATRREKLEADARAAAESVKTSGKPWRMPLLNSLDRRVIHKVLQDDADIRTESGPADADGRKRVVVYPVKANEPRQEEPTRSSAADLASYMSSSDDPPPASL